MATVDKVIIERPRQYSNSKVYKIQPIGGGKEGDIYIGSTTKKYLSQRMVQHKSAYTQWVKNICERRTTVFDLFDKYGFDGCEIVLIQNVSCNSKDELLQREKYYIQNELCINRNIPTRTLVEWRKDNYDKIKEYEKQYRENNVNLIKERIKSYRTKNQEKIKEMKRQPVNCECGCSFTFHHRSRHLKTKIHLAFVNSNQS